MGHRSDKKANFGRKADKEQLDHQFLNQLLDIMDFILKFRI